MNTTQDFATGLATGLASQPNEASSVTASTVTTETTPQSFASDQLQDSGIHHRCMFALDKAIEIIETKCKRVPEKVAVGGIFRVAKILDYYIIPYHHGNQQRNLLRYLRHHDIQRGAVDAIAEQHRKAKEIVCWLLDKSDAEQLRRNDINEIIKKVKYYNRMMRFNEGVVASILHPALLTLPLDDTKYESPMINFISRNKKLPEAVRDVDKVEKRLDLYLEDYNKEMTDSSGEVFSPLPKLAIDDYQSKRPTETTTTAPKVLAKPQHNGFNNPKMKPQDTEIFTENPPPPKRHRHWQEEHPHKRHDFERRHRRHHKQPTQTTTTTTDSTPVMVRRRRK